MPASRPKASGAASRISEKQKLATARAGLGAKDVRGLMCWPAGGHRPTPEALEVVPHHELRAGLAGERVEVGGQPGEVPSDDRIIPPADESADADAAEALLERTVQSHGPVGVKRGADGRELPGARQS